MNQEDKAARFISSIIQDANAGRAFVPFVGSGLSSPSGIIMGLEFTNYLAFTAYLVLCDPAERGPTHGEGQETNWSLQKQGWPPLPSEKEVDEATAWVRKKFKLLCARFGLEPSYDGSRKPRIKALVKKSMDSSTLDELVSSLAHPPIPMILRSSSAAIDEQRVKQFKKTLADRNRGSQPMLEKLAPTWSHQDLSFGDAIIDVGIRTLADWRETLAFLAMIRVDESEPPQLSLGSLDTSVIDDFNATITRDKRPSLGHKIIAHLSEPLRISTILTTNFDTLTEDAYRAMSLPLTVLPVSSKGDLPHPRTVSSCDALVKLHGESHDTRADLSLDDEPTEEDKTTFSAYMRRGTGHLLRKRNQNASNPSQHCSSRLLVVGYSGSDHRCVQMMKHWLEHTPDDPMIYWICFSSYDEERVLRTFASTSYAGRIKTALTPRPDLLLYDLYQRLVLALPPGGLTYEFSHVLPPDRRQAYDHPQAEVAQTLEKVRAAKSGDNPLVKRTRKLLRDATVMASHENILAAVNGNVRDKTQPRVLSAVQPWEPLYRFPLDTEDKASAEAVGKKRTKAVSKLAFSPTVINSCGGIVRASALTASELSSQQFKKVFWVELQDYMDVDSVLRDLLRSLALRFGQFQARHVTMHPIAEGLGRNAEFYQTKKGRQQLKRLKLHFKTVLAEYRVDPNSLVIMLCGRDSYGNCSGIVPSTWTQESGSFYQLHFLIELLGRVGIPTIYFPCSPERAKRKRAFIDSMVVGEALSAEQSGSAPQVQEKDNAWPHDPLYPSSKLASMSVPIEKAAEDLSVFREIVIGSLEEFYDINFQHNDQQHLFTRKPESSFDRSQINKMEFLYALTLFRHSRHTNAISSEGAFPCPYRFQSRALDNDFIRAMRANRWISELRGSRVFFSKPGGALWMHRDVRQAIHNILEQTVIPNPNQQRSNRCFREIRGRLHFWIGDWYQKAYCSSGHLTPVIESVYHLVSSAVYAQFAFPKRFPENGDDCACEGNFNTPSDQEKFRPYQRMMFESSIVQASKVLLLSWHSIELWQASAASVGWLSDAHRKEIKRSLCEVADTITADTKQRKRMKGHVNEFCRIHKALGAIAQLEGGGTERGATSMSSTDTIALALIPKKKVRGKETSLGHSVSEVRLPEAEFDASIASAFEGCRCGATDLWHNLSAIVEGDDRTRSEFGELKADWKATAHPVDFQNVIWTLGESAYVLLRRAKLEFHATNKISDAQWMRSTVCCNLGIDLCKHLPAWMLNYEVHSKVKIHSIYAIGLANMGRFYEANRHLNESQAILSKWSSGNSRDQAIICLRRAEVKLTECYWISLFLRKKMDLRKADRVTVKDQTFIMPSSDVGAVECWESDELDRHVYFDGKLPRQDDKILPPSIFECFRSSRPLGFKYREKEQSQQWQLAAQVRLRLLFRSVLDEAVSSLEIAEKNLGGVVQSSLWWSRLHTLRLRVYGLLKYLRADAELSIVFRKQSADNGIFKNFFSAVRIAGDDDFRRLRALRYFLEANRWYCNFMQPAKAGSDSDSRLLEKYLPESLAKAREVARELKRSNDQTENGDEDLLWQAINRCFKDFEELGVDWSNSK